MFNRLIQSEIALKDAESDAVKMPFPSDSTEDEEEVHASSPLDEIFALLEFDILIAKEACIEIDMIEVILDHIVDNLRNLDANSLVTFCQDAMDTKGRELVKGAARTLILLMEIVKGESCFSNCSSNMSNKKGVRVVEEDGSMNIWTITKASFQQSTSSILRKIMYHIDTEISINLAKILDNDDLRKVTAALDTVKIVQIKKKSAYFIVKFEDIPTTENEATVPLSFSYQAYSKEDEPVGEKCELSWSCSLDQAKAISELEQTLDGVGLRGDIVETCSLDYALHLCRVLDLCIDPFKLGSTIDKVNGVRAEEEADDDAKGVEPGDESQEDGNEPITPFELCRMLKEEIDSESEDIRYDFGMRKSTVKNSTREKNGLASLVQICKILSPKCAWLQSFGDHFDSFCARFLSTKLGTEFKSFLSNGNPMYRYECEIV